MTRISEKFNTELYLSGANAGVIEVPPTFTDNNNGTYDISDFTCLLYDNDSHANSLYTYNISTANGFTMIGRDISDTPNEVRYLVVDNTIAGSPVLRDLTYAELSLINESDIIPVITMYNEDNTLIHYIGWDTLGKGLSNMIHKRLVKTDRFKRESGLALSVTDPTKSVQIGSGLVWIGAVENTLGAFSSATATYRWYHWHNSGVNLTVNITTVGGGGDVTAAAINTAGTGYMAGMDYPVLGGTGTGFVVTIDTVGATGNVTAISISAAGTGYLDTDDNLSVYQGWQRMLWTDGSGTYNNSHYDGGSAVGVLPLTNNYYTVNWVYRDLENSPHAGFVLGGNYQTYAEALASQPRTDLPNEFHVMSTLVGRIITQEGLTVATSTSSLVESAYETIYSGQPVSFHNDLGELQGGTTNEYYHVTSAQSTGIVAQNPTVLGADWLHGMGDVATTLAFDNVTHIFTLSGTNFKYYYQGKEVTVASSVTIDLDTAGGITFPVQGESYFIYFADTTGVLTASEGPWDLNIHVPVALITWNSATTTGTAAVFDERHGYRRDLQWHLWAHSTVNTRYLSGFVKTLPTGATPNDLSIGGGSIADEDIIHTIGAKTTARIWYEVSAGVWTFKDDVLPYYDTTTPGGGSPEWPLTTSAYALTPLAAAKYMPTWCYASPDITEPIYIIVPSMTSTGLYNSATKARQAPIPSVPEIQEMKLLYRFVWSNTGALSYDATQDDFRTSGLIASAGVSQNVSASQVSFAPTGNVTSISVQGAIEEIISDIRPTYSELVMTTTGTLTVTTAGTYYVMNDTNVTGTTNFVLGQSVNVTTNANACTFTIVDAGVYEVIFNASYNNTNVNRVNRGRFYVDTVQQTGGFNNSGTNTASASQNVMASQYLSLTAGQVIDFRLTADTSGTVQNFTMVNFRIRRIA